MNGKWHYIENQGGSSEGDHDDFRGIKRIIHDGIQNASDAGVCSNCKVELIKHHEEKCKDYNPKVKFNISIFKKNSNDYNDVIDKEYKARAIKSMKDYPLYKDNENKFNDVKNILQNDTNNLVVVEDYGTTGLTGQNRQEEKYDNEDKETNFYGFLYSLENSRKSSGSGRTGGSAGHGKIIFRNLSSLKTIFYFSNLVNENKFKQNSIVGGKGYFLGSYYHDEISYTKESYFHLREKGNQPLSKEEDINKFREIFSFERKKEPGTSIAMPFVSDENIKKNFKNEEIAKEVLESYLPAVINKQLEVNFKEFDKKLISINGYQEKSLNKFEKTIPGLQERIKFLREILKDNEPNKEIDLGTISEKNYFAKLSELQKEISDQMFMDKFQNFHVLNFKVNFIIKKNEKENKKSYIKFSIKKSEEEHKPEFYRATIRISDVSRDKIKMHFYFAPEETVLYDLLKKSENAKHDNWNTTNTEAEEIYRNHDSIIKFIKSLPIKVLESYESQDSVSSDDFFSFFKVRGYKKPGPTPPKPSSVDFKYFEDDDGNIVISGNTDCNKCKISGEAEIKFAYSTSGLVSSIRNYSKLDFKLEENFVINTENCRRESTKDNSIRISWTDDDVKNNNFKIKIIGFDKNRNITIIGEHL